MSTEVEQQSQSTHEHEVTIYINGRSVPVTDNSLTFDQVVALSGLPTGPNTIFTITYRRGEGNNPQGSMIEGVIRQDQERDDLQCRTDR